MKNDIDSIIGQLSQVKKGVFTLEYGVDIRTKVGDKCPLAYLCSKHTHKKVDNCSFDKFMSILSLNENDMDAIISASDSMSMRTDGIPQLRDKILKAVGLNEEINS